MLDVPGGEGKEGEALTEGRGTHRRKTGNRNMTASPSSRQAEKYQ